MERSEHWLNRDRLTVYPRITLALFLIISVAWVLLSKNLVDIKGKPLGYDFITFWAASHFALTGHPQDAYDIVRLFEAEKLAVPASQSVFAWYYPPSFYLVVLPLALLPYLAAYFAFVSTTLAAYVSVFRRVVSDRDAMWLLAGFSGIFLNIFHGQNAFLTATLAASALLCLERRPLLSGALAGLLVIKPHLAILFPVALIAIGAWRTFFAAGLAAAALLAIGTGVLGTATLSASLGSLSLARIFLESGVLPWAKMPTVFAFMRLLGMPVAAAYVAHALVACGAMAAVWIVWRRSNALPLRGAALMSATFLVSPYLFDYDLAWLAFPIAWLALAGRKSGWLRAEREILVAAWALPMVMAPVATLTTIQIGPAILIALLWSVMRRAGVWQDAAAPAARDESAAGRCQNT